MCVERERERETRSDRRTTWEREDERPHYSPKNSLFQSEWLGFLKALRSSSTRGGSCRKRRACCEDRSAPRKLRVRIALRIWRLSNVSEHVRYRITAKIQRITEEKRGSMINTERGEHGLSRARSFVRPCILFYSSLTLTPASQNLSSGLIGTTVDSCNPCMAVAPFRVGSSFISFKFSLRIQRWVFSL